jgi:hypothetical protein
MTALKKKNHNLKQQEVILHSTSVEEEADLMQLMIKRLETLILNLLIINQKRRRAAAELFVFA